MDDRAAATMGFVLAGVALAAALPDWGGWLRPVTIGLSGLAFVALALRRYDRLERGVADGMAVVGGLGTMGAAIGVVVGSNRGGEMDAIGFEPILTGVAALGAAVMAYADWRDIGRARLVTMITRSMSATGIGLSGLLAILAWSVVVGGVFRSMGGEITPSTGAILSSLALGLGTGSVAWFYLQATDRDLGFFDINRPTRWDGVVVVVGISVLLGVNFGIGLAFQAFDLPAAQHTIFDIAQDDPGLLLVLIPLSLLLIGPGEELLYRNIVQKSLYGVFSRPGAVVVASAIFAAAHVPAYSSAGSTALSILTTLVVVFALSLVLGFAFERTENVIVSALIHGSFNAIAFAATYAQLAA